MAKRRRLADLVDEETQKQPTLEPETLKPETLESEGDIPQHQAPPEQESTNNKEQSGGGLPKYLTLVRKEARLREEQIDALTALARKLNRKRQGGERLTENTLIRVAVDLLLSHGGELQGTTEEEIRAALGL